jgi:glucose-6-phosphate-specific signal transduction histidine kinase
MAASVPSSRVRWWWILLVVPFFLIEGLVRHKHLNGARALLVLPILYLFVGLGIESAWRLGVERWPKMASLTVISLAATLAISGTRLYFEWARSEKLREALEPAIPFESFPAWQEEKLGRMSE